MGSHKKRTLNFIDLWTEILVANIKKNDSNFGDLQKESMYVDMTGIYSGERNVTFIYSIDGYPNELDDSFRSIIRDKCKAGVRVSFISPFEQHTIDWDSAQMKSRLRTWRLLEKDEEEVDAYNIHYSLATMDNQDWKKDSLIYLSTADIRRHRKVYKFRSLMLISGYRGKDFNDSVKEITKLCRALGFKFSRVVGDIPAYLRVFSPFTNTFDSNVLKQCGCVTIPDELLSHFNTYAQGTIGIKGTYFGTDIYSGFPCFKEVKKTTESAENWLITAETGGGKSYFTKGVIFQILASPFFNGTIMDVEGFEYIPLLRYIENNDLCVLVNMAEGTGAYYDPVEIVITGDAELDADMYNLSASFTLSLFKCLLGNTSVQDEWVDIAINDAVSLTYANAGVESNDMRTWRRSSGLTLFSVYDTLKSLKYSGNSERAIASMFNQSLFEERFGIGTKMTKNDVNRLVTSNEGYQQAIELSIAKLSRFFEPNGVRASVFSKRITVDEIRDAKLVICSFGMAGKSEKNVDPIQMALMQLYAAHISHLRSIFSKHDGKFNFKLWEEFQRWGGFPDADKTINVALTGGRKLGDVNIILTNNVGAMLKDDKFGVFSNITSIAIGCIADSQVRKDLCERLTIPQMLPELDTIVEHNKDLTAYIEGDSDLMFSDAYRKAFLIGLDKTVYTIAKMSLPAELRNSKIFRTGITKKT